MRNFASYKEGAIVPTTDPTKINKFKSRASAHRFRQNSRYKATKKQPVQFKKLQAIYETEIVNSIDEMDIENQSDMVHDFDSKLIQLYSKNGDRLTDDHTSVHSNSFSDDGERALSRESVNSSKRGSFSGLSLSNTYTPRRSRANSNLEIEDSKFEDIGSVTDVHVHSDRSFLFF
jgi:hypothetical protein